MRSYPSSMQVSNRCLIMLSDAPPNRAGRTTPEVDEMAQPEPCRARTKRPALALWRAGCRDGRLAMPRTAR